MRRHVFKSESVAELKLEREKKVQNAETRAKKGEKRCPA